MRAQFAVVLGGFFVECETSNGFSKLRNSREPLGGGCSSKRTVVELAQRNAGDFDAISRKGLQTPKRGFWEAPPHQDAHHVGVENVHASIPELDRSGACLASRSNDVAHDIVEI